jgi:hypothetical protein
MNYKIAKKEISHYETTGVCTGDWISQSRYIYNFHNPYPEEGAFIFESHSRINLEFLKGGSVDFIVTVVFIVPFNGVRPLLMDTILLAEESFKLAKEEFFNFIQFDGDKEKVWVWEDENDVALILSEKISTAFPLND